MSEYETAEGSMSNITDKRAAAFEYVAGTLRGDERSAFQQLLREDKELQTEVQLWEEQLMTKHFTTHERPPAEETWRNIEAQLFNNRADKAPPKKSRRNTWFDALLGWKTAGLGFAMLWMLTLSLWVFNAFSPQSQTLNPNLDYVAVLTDEKEQALLTALTSSTGRTLWLKWEADQTELFEPENSIQLWAQSRRDGQVRPIAVFDNNTLTSIDLDEASLRLIHDSEYLLLTLEEEGGSAIDEPSEQLLARGVCVRLSSAT